MSEKVYVLGVDGGATKTASVVLDAEGTVLGRGSGGPGNYNSAGIETVRQSLRDAIESAAAAAGLTVDQMAAIGLGMAGVDRPEDRRVIEEILTGIAHFPVVWIDNDAVAALAGGVGKLEGIVIVAGTGTIAYGFNAAGQRHRAAGWGALLGDGGSGYDIAMRALGAAARSYDGRGPETSLGQRILDFLGLRWMPDLISWAYGEPYSWDRFAGLAVVVPQAAAAGDPVAQDILRAAGQELGCAINAVARRLNMTDQPFPVVLVGGVFHSRTPALLQALEETVHAVAPQAEIRFPERDPAVGAGLLALQALKKVSQNSL